MIRRLSPFLVLAIAAACGGKSNVSVHAPKHIFVIMMENHGTKEIIGNTQDAPYINQLASQYGVATNYFGVTHPSLPNYLAMISGDFQGIWDDCKAGQTVTCAPEEFVAGSGDATSGASLTSAQVASASAQAHWFSGTTIVDQLESKGMTWKAYMESINTASPTDEYAPIDLVNGTPTPRKLYAQKHNPFMYFANIRNSPARMANIVALPQLSADLGAAASTPNFVFIAPNQCNDMHGISSTNAAAVGLPDCAYAASGTLDHAVIARGDKFLKATVTQIMASPAWAEGSVIAIPWDEDDYAGYAGCCNSPVGNGGTVLGGANAPLIVISSSNIQAQTTATPMNHYSLLGAIEKAWGLPCLGNACNVKDSELPTSLF